jgi:hypothetical protein
LAQRFIRCAFGPNVLLFTKKQGKTINAGVFLDNARVAAYDTTFYNYVCARASVGAAHTITVKRCNNSVQFKLRPVYFAEIFRDGIESIPKGQWEAGKVLGLSKWQIERKIILPQVTKKSCRRLEMNCLHL